MTFTIVIPVYNGEKYLEETILSALRQSRKADEIIVFDDGSKDNSANITLKYRDKVKYIYNEKGPSGFVNGWNKAISHSTCDFISVLHQDDILAPDFLMEAENILKVHKHVKHFFCICDKIDDTGKIIDNLSYSNEFIDSESEVVIFKGQEYMVAYQKKYGNSLHIHRCPGVITHRSIFYEKNCWYNPNAGHIADDDFFYRVGFLTDVAGFLRPLSRYRIHPESETSSIGDFKLVSRLSNDYLFQFKQWSSDKRLSYTQKLYFRINFLKYNKRLLGYSFKFFEIKNLNQAIINYIQYLLH